MTEAIKRGEKSIVVVGLGYVGLPLAVSFAKHVNVIGFDINAKKVDMYKSGIDVTNEVGNDAIKESSVFFTSDPADIKKGDFIIVAVPTPTDEHRNPDLTPVIGASTVVGQNLKKGAIVVYESTVYPGVTEDECVPVLERESGMKCGIDFKVGYSPERINPGDKVHRFETITKIVSGMDEESLDIIAGVYEIAVKAGVYRASSIKVAEAAKVIENSQRDINIAFVNELSKIFNIMGIDTLEVLKAAGTKWNFLPFRPGLVGGHCIGVDPYYLTYKAQELGYQPEVILAGRRINDSMGKYVAENVVKLMIKDGVNVKGANVVVLGVTFKENVPDVRNSKVADIVHELMEYEVNVSVLDPYAESDEVMREYGFTVAEKAEKADAVILAVAHNEYKSFTPSDYKNMLKAGRTVIADIKGILEPADIKAQGLTYWRL